MGVVFSNPDGAYADPSDSMESEEEREECTLRNDYLFTSIPDLSDV